MKWMESVPLRHRRRITKLQQPSFKLHRRLTSLIDHVTDFYHAEVSDDVTTYIASG